MNESTMKILKAKNRANVLMFWSIIGYLGLIGCFAAVALYQRADAILMAGQ